MLGQSAPQSLALGQLGAKVYSAGGPFTGSWGRLSFLTATVLSALTSSTLTFDASIAIADVTFPAGMEVQGVFTSMTITSGIVVAYTV